MGKELPKTESFYTKAEALEQRRIWRRLGYGAKLRFLPRIGKWIVWCIPDWRGMVIKPEESKK